MNGRPKIAYYNIPGEQLHYFTSDEARMHLLRRRCGQVEALFKVTMITNPPQLRCCILGDGDFPWLEAASAVLATPK